MECREQIVECQRNMRELTVAMDKVRRRFLAATCAHMRIWYAEAAEQAIHDKAPRVRMLGPHGFPELKKHVEAIVDKVAENVTIAISGTEHWLADGRLFPYDGDLPANLDAILRRVAGLLAYGLEAVGYIDKDDSDWNNSGTRRTDHSARNFVWSDEMVTIVKEYNTLAEQKLSLQQAHEALENERTDSDAVTLWRNAKTQLAP
jgi:hypothetical protein